MLLRNVYHAIIMFNNEPWYLHQLTVDELKIFVKEAMAGKINHKACIGTIP